MKILIYRGANEIGGTCIQLSTDNTTILLDLGLSFSKNSKEIDVLALKPDAVLSGEKTYHTRHLSFAGIPQRSLLSNARQHVLRDLAGIFDCAHGPCYITGANAERSCTSV